MVVENQTTDPCFRWLAAPGFEPTLIIHSQMAHQFGWHLNKFYIIVRLFRVYYFRGKQFKANVKAKQNWRAYRLMNFYLRATLGPSPAPPSWRVIKRVHRRFARINCAAINELSQRQERHLVLPCGTQPLEHFCRNYEYLCVICFRLCSRPEPREKQITKRVFFYLSVSVQYLFIWFY